MLTFIGLPEKQDMESKAFHEGGVTATPHSTDVQPWRPSFFSIAVIKLSEQKLLGKERVYWFTLSGNNPALKKVGPRT